MPSAFRLASLLTVTLAACAGDLSNPGGGSGNVPTEMTKHPPLTRPRPSETVVSGTMPKVTGDVAPSLVTRRSSSDGGRLGRLVAERAHATPEQTYRIGPDDLLEIAVFDLQDMNRKVRVDASGRVQLPLIGEVQVAGMSEAGVSKEIAGRLADFVRNPQVTVFVQEYKSRQVAVTGSVAKPGLYPLTRNRRTILDMISEAGGLTKDAGGLLEFIPAEEGKVPAGQVFSAEARTFRNDPHRADGIVVVARAQTMFALANLYQVRSHLLPVGARCSL